ncbi:MAG: methyltransferase domain-containing protein [Treponema sp.]|nr:methyltransferase domain-containing protein [Treponema sp.]
MKTKRAVIIQCRLSSSRLKEKALLKIGDKTILEMAMQAMLKVKADRYFVATDEKSLPYLKPVVLNNGYEIFAGDLNNVLDRFCKLIKKIKVDTVIRATADNPFLIYEAACQSVDEFEKLNKSGSPCEYFTFSGLPHGSGVEIFNANSLLLAQKLTDSSYDKEHVGPALYNHPEKFKCVFAKAPSGFKHPQLRTTVDTYSDYLRCICAYNHLTKEKKQSKPFECEKIIEAFSSKEVLNPVIYIPSVQKGHGTGHLRRILNACTGEESFVYIPKNHTLKETEGLLQEAYEKGLRLSQIIDTLPDESLQPVYVTDCFKTSKEQYSSLENGKCILSIDEGSENKDCSDYLLDIIPSADENKNVNYFNSSLIEKPENIRKTPVKKIQKALICFGGEDPLKMTEPVKNILEKILPQAEITCITNPVKNLKEKLYQYDLVVTHYGLTAFEAMYAKCAVLLLCPSKLHERLSKKYSFAYIPFNKITEQNFEAALKNENLFCKNIIKTQKTSLKTVVKTISSGIKNTCPVCRHNNMFDKVVFRNENRTFRSCSTCGLIYFSYTLEKEKTYEKAYFFEDYKKQYGKTYEEDFDSIKKHGLKRASIINSLCRTKEKNLFDIGCAYGPFLSAAYDKGFVPFGTDICEPAVKYVKTKLQYPACTGVFPQIDTGKEFGISEFDVCTMWYVIEHFKDLDSVLQKVNSILKKNGIFAFSTPSGSGISSRLNKDSFLANSPSDHYSIWLPFKANKVLKKYGFKVIKIVSTGHHPERFTFIKCKKNGFVWKCIDKISRLFMLGDTVEIYCRKVRQI